MILRSNPKKQNILSEHLKHTEIGITFSGIKDTTSAELALKRGPKR